MSQNLGSLVVSLSANTVEFVKGMDRAAYQTDQAMRKMQRSADMTKAAIIGLTTGALSALSVNMFVGVFKGAIDGMDALNDLADATGASIEKLSALEDVAARTGAGMDTVSSAMLKFSKLLTDAKPGSEAEAGLKAFGLEAQKLKDMDPADAMLQYAQAIGKFADDGNKARLVQEQTGKSVKELAPFLKDLAEQHALVATITTKQAEEAEKFNKELFNMQKNAKDLARTMAGELATTINATIEQFRRGQKEGKSFFQQAFISNDEMIARFNKAKGIQGGATGTWGGAQGTWDTPPEPRPSVKVPNPKPIKSGGGTPKDLDADFKAYLRNLQNQIQKTQELTVVEKLLSDVRNGTLTVSPKQEAQLTALAETIDKEKELVEILKLKRDVSIAAGDAVNKSNMEYQALLSSLLDATPSANLAKQRSDVRLLTDEFEAGRLNEQLYLEAVSSRLDLTGEKITQTKSAAEELGMTFSSAFEDAIVGGKAFSEVLDGLVKHIARVAIRKAVTEPMTNYVSAAVKTFLPSFAVGTEFVPRDMIAQIHKGEKIIPAAQNNGSSQQPVTVIQNFTVGDVASISMVRQAVAGSEKRIAGAMGRSMSYGGALS